MSASDVILSGSSAVTALGVFALVYQLRLTRQQMRNEFERTFVSRYEAIVGRIPLEMLLGEMSEVTKETRRAFYDYFELCEEELFFRERNKISEATWTDWWEGICLHLRRPAFRAAFGALDGAANFVGTSGGVNRVDQFTLLRQAVSAVDHGKPFDPRR